MQLNGQEPITLSYDPAKFGSHRHSGCESMFLDHVIKGLHEIIGRSLSC